MAEIRIEFDKSVELYLNKLVDILFYKSYFSFKENAFEYVDEIIDEISNIHIYPKRKASSLFIRNYGEDLYYINIRKNKRTSWIVYFNFDKSEMSYKIRHIINNHFPEYNATNKRTRKRKFPK